MYNAILEFCQSPVGGIIIAIFVIGGIIATFSEQFEMDGYSWGDIGSFFKKIFIFILAILILPFPFLYDKLPKENKNGNS